MDNKENNTNNSRNVQDQKPSMADSLKLIAAFSIPMLVFIAVAFSANKYLPGLGSYEQLRPLAAFVAGALVTTAVLFIMKMIKKYLHESK